MAVGIVVEYNPFHNGHLYQINEIRKMTSDVIIAVTSGDFVQRGEFSFINKWEKTEAALENGVDLVVELPLYYSIQNAEIFCREAVKILNYLEINKQFFGAESKNISELNEVIQIQNTDSYVKLLKKYLKSGENYSVSHYKALKEFGLEYSFLSNNILAMEYIKTIQNNKYNIEPFIIRRKNTGYNEKNINDNITSATNIRKMYLDNELSRNKEVVPQKVYSIITEKIRNEHYINEKLYELFKYKLLTYPKEKLREIYDIKDEFLNRLMEQAKKHQNYNSFIKYMNTRNFSESKIKRSILNTLLDINKEDIKNSDIDYIRILGFNSKGREYLHKLIKQNKKQKIYTNWKDIEKLEIQKVKIEKSGFLIKELILQEKERLNLLIKER